jgi:hypothetical protein
MRVDEAFVKKMRKKWEGEVYQSWEKEWRKIDDFAKKVSMFAGKRVFEVGPNAGLHAIQIVDVAEAYFGAERKMTPFRQLKCTMKETDKRNWTIYHETCEMWMDHHFEQDKPNAFFASYVLYHLLESELDTLRDLVLPVCNPVLVYTRNEDRSQKDVSNGREMWRKENVEAYLKAAGLTVTTEMGPQDIFFVTTGTR